MNAHTHVHTHSARAITNVGFLLPPPERQPGLGSKPRLLSILENAPHNVMLTAVCVCLKKKKKKGRKKKQPPRNENLKTP